MFMPASASEKMRALPFVFVSNWTVKPLASIDTNLPCVTVDWLAPSSRMQDGTAELFVSCARDVSVVFWASREKFDVTH